jgi:membrane-bound inhibitor of C-type lysozyme
MPTLLRTLLLACGLAMAAASASAAEPVAKPAAKASKAKAKPAKAAKAAPAAPVTEPEPDVTDTVTTEYNCELGNKVTVYHNEKDDSHIAVRWKKRLHRLTRVGTTTGAQRFENQVFGLIWIGIPAKAMLLDSKLNRQLANECKNPEQAKPAVPAEAAETKIAQ